MWNQHVSDHIFKKLIVLKTVSLKDGFHIIVSYFTLWEAQFCNNSYDVDDEEKCHILDEI